MAERVCCVCSQVLGAEAKTIGTRAYCEQHYARVSLGRKAMWVGSIAAVVGLVAFALVVNLIASLTKPVLQGAALWVVGLLLALLPALLWLVVFYLQDRLEPEPKGYVLGVLALGGFLGVTVALPVVRDLFHVQTWLGQNAGWVQVLGSVLIVGFTQEYLKYAAVRYTIYRSAEFDQRIDGIIYGAAAGLGLATALSLAQVVGSGGVQLGATSMRIVISALAHASFGGITGYFLGRAKFENMGPWWLPAGLALAALCNGLVTYLLGEVSVRGLTFNPVYGLILAAGVAVACFIVLFIFIQRANKATLAGA